MSVIFGWGELKVKQYSSVEIGIDESVLPNTQIQLMQKYFHLFFIPFFGTGKSWYFNSNGYWLKLFPEYEIHISEQYKNTAAPWYTFSGILLLCLIGFGFFIYNTADVISTNSNYEDEFQKSRKKLTTQLSRINEHYYIGLEDKNDSYIGSDLFLKVERINGELVTCSIINLNQKLEIAPVQEERITTEEVASSTINPYDKLNTAPLYIESIYKVNKESLDSITLTKQSLINGLPLTYQNKLNSSINNISIQGQSYFISEIQEHDKPLIEVGYKRSLSTDGTFMLSFVNQLEIATLLSIENDNECKLVWTSKLPMTLPYGSMTEDDNRFKSYFELHGTGYKADEPFKFVLKCIDKKQKPINYLVRGDNEEIAIEEIY